MFVAVLCVFLYLTYEECYPRMNLFIDNSQAADEAQNLTLKRIFERAHYVSGIY